MKSKIFQQHNSRSEQQFTVRQKVEDKRWYICSIDFLTPIINEHKNLLALARKTTSDEIKTLRMRYKNSKHNVIDVSKNLGHNIENFASY